MRGDTCVVFGLGGAAGRRVASAWRVAFTLSTVIWQGCGGGLLQLSGVSGVGRAYPHELGG